MIKGAVAARYAQALFDVARDNNRVAETENELRGFMRLVDESRDLQQVLYNPQVPVELKKEIVREAFGKALSGTTLNFLCLVLDRRREPYLKGIAERFFGLANETRNIVEAEVTTALELSVVHKVNLMQVLSRMTGKELRIRYQVDPDILGGLVVRLGDRIIDGSVKRQLERLKDSIRETKVG
ncbi:MAG: F0F1 ATP synthase subunit delta [Bacillota bacterium]